MAQSIFNPQTAPQVITVLDCESATCLPINTLLNKLFASINANVEPDAVDNTAYAVTNFTPVTYPSVMVVGISQDRVLRNTFNGLRMSGFELDSQYARYGMVNPDAAPAIDPVSAVVATAAAAWVSTAVSFNTDHIAAWAFNVRMRLFGRIMRVTVPSNISRLEIQPSGVASPYPEIITVNIKEDDCREITLFVFARAQGYRFVSSALNPTDQLTLMYQLPSETAHNENGVTGGSLFVQLRAFDYTGAQVVANVTVDAWQVPYTSQLMKSIKWHHGILGNGVVWTPDMSHWNVPNTQIALP